jgi:hypothetical protein
MTDVTFWRVEDRFDPDRFGKGRIERRTEKETVICVTV